MPSRRRERSSSTVKSGVAPNSVKFDGEVDVDDVVGALEEAVGDGFAD